MGIPVVIVLAVGIEQAIAVMLLGGVDIVIAPHIAIVIDMEDKQTCAWGGIVPAVVLTILDEVELIVVARIADDVGVATLAHGFHACDADIVRQFDGRLPPHQHLL